MGTPSLPPDLAPLRGRVADPLLELAARDGRPVRAAAGARLFAAGERVVGLHLIVDGSVRVVREAAERAVVVHGETAGGLLGEVALFSDGIYPGTAVAVEPVRLRVVSADAVWRALAERPALAEVLLRRLAGRTREVIARLDRIAHLTVARRLAVHVHGRAAAARGDTISLGMTQAELAAELGTVKELVVRELRTLRRLRLIEPAGGGRYRVVDAEGLRALAFGAGR